MNLNEVYKKHYIAVVGGSISGSEAASLLAENGFRVVVFEMNELPYGKIEDGLPNWHINLRNRQINEINKKLNHPNIRYVPCTKIGETFALTDLVKNWGFSAVIIANGAWADRRLPVPKIDKFIDKDVIYQNSLVYWFNHKHQPDYRGKNYFIKNEAVVVGGGLASLDVVKIIMIELVMKQLYIKKGIRVDMFTLEKEGIHAILQRYNLRLSDLEIKKAKLVYRRTAKDMPLKTPKDAKKESMELAKDVSEKLLHTYAKKYMFDFIPLSILVDFIEENDKLKGVVFQKVTIENGEIIPVDNSMFVIKTEMLVSSIGSLPEKIKGLPYENALLKMDNEKEYLVYGFNNVFAVGNAVTGRGNIIVSKQHGKEITKMIIDNHLTDDEFEKWLIAYNTQVKNKVAEQIQHIIEEITNYEFMPETIINSIIERTGNIHKKIKYTSYNNWIQKHLPERLEDFNKNKVPCKCI